MIDRFKDFIESNKLFSKEDSLLLALSGGADSIALFYLLKEEGFSFSVAHVNYSLRGEESIADAAFVSSICKANEVKFYLKEVLSDYWEKGMNIQAEARDIRYAYFDELLKENNYSWILTAHHKDDNTETILMNITRGTGLKGLMGLEKVKGNIIRPLLFAEREEIEKYLKSKNVDWREDSSNTSDKYKRNRFRNEIIPLLKKENPALNQALERMVENISYVNSSFIDSLEDFKDAFYSIQKGQIIIETISKKRLGIYLFDLIKEFNFNRDQVQNILYSIEEVGKVFISKSHELFIDRQKVIIVAKDFVKDEKIEIHENTSAIIDPMMLKFSTQKEGKIEGKKNVETFDKEKLLFPIILRKWKEGDRIQPLGMKGNKKVSDILIDKKVDRASKKNVFLLESEGEVVWIPGLVLSEKVKIDNETKVFWRVEMLS